MKQMLLLLCFVPLTVQALDRPQLDKMLATAVSAKGRPYLEARQAVLDLGTNALPLLAQAATDPALTWQQRLVARICYERMTRGADIEALRRYDWRANPQYNKKWEDNILGARVHLGEIAIPKCIDAGLWYYYVELPWKDTKEYALHPSDPAIPFDRAINDDRRIYCSWLDWCIASLKGQPEYYYLIQALTEKLESDASLSEPPNAELYRYLLLHKETNAVPVLVKRYDTYNKHEDNGGEAFAGAREITYRGMFEPILEIADSRHANLLEKFITEKPVLEPLKEKLAEVRKRSAPPPLVEPPFRLNRQPVKS